MQFFILIQTKLTIVAMFIEIQDFTIGVPTIHLNHFNQFF